MTVLFFVFVGLVIFHFWWDAIIAPSIRLEIRYELFAMRDRLRRLKIQHDEQLPDQLFELLQHLMNKEIAYLHRATIGSFYFAYRQYGNDKQIQESFEKFLQLVKECPIDEVRSIWDRCGLISVCALIVNSGGWLFYIVPVLPLAISFRTIQVLSTKLLVGLTDKEVNQLFPDTRQIVLAS